MTALALPRQTGLLFPSFEPWRLLRPLRMAIEGQFSPFQRLQGDDIDRRKPSAATLTTLSLFGQTTGLDATAEYPASIQAGDVAIIYDGAESPTGGLVTPSGYTVLSDIDNGTVFGVVSAKVLIGSETAETVMAANGDSKWVLAVYRGDVAITSFTSRSMNEESTSGNPVSQTIAVGSTPSYPALVWANAYSNNTSTFATNTVGSALTTSNAKHWAGYEIFNSSAANRTFDKNDNGQNVAQSGYLTFNGL